MVLTYNSTIKPESLCVPPTLPDTTDSFYSCLNNSTHNISCNTSSTTDCNNNKNSSSRCNKNSDTTDCCDNDSKTASEDFQKYWT